MDVSAWLGRLGLDAYAPAFAANDVDLETLRSLTADDLRELGVASIGHRRRLIEAIAGLDREPAPEAVAPASPRGPERRPVTVLFADLCGYTALSRELNDERLRALMGRFFAFADDIIKGHGGTIDKHIGDAVMALFGAPVAHGNDVLRAVRAASDLRAHMPEFAREFGRDLAVHAGLAVGELIVDLDRQSYSVVGEAANLAARLTALAAPGEILVSDAIRHELRGEAAVHALGERAIKGFAAPVAVWRLGAIGAPDAGAVEAMPFVGREGERAQMAALLGNCQSRGHGAVVYVRGEPGIGKSRLIGEALGAAARAGMACHVCHVLDYGAGHARDPLRRLAASLLRLPPDATEMDRSAAAASAIAAMPDGARLGPFLTEMADGPLGAADRAVLHACDQAMRRQRGLEALAALAHLALARGPVLLIVEDVHWAADDVVAAVSTLARIARDSALVLALTSRPENERLYEALRRQPSAAPLATIDLGPLHDRDVAAVAGRLGPLPEATILKCVERAGGNPLFLEQLLHNAAEASGELPPSLRSIILARVDRLDAADRAAIHAAAVLGQRFDTGALRRALGQPRYDPTGLIRAGLVNADGADLMFAHALIQEAVYRSLLGEAKQALHRNAADWFKDRDPLLHAMHLDRAGAPEAADAYRAAAQNRLEHYRSLDAIPLAERGLELAADSATRAPLLVIKGDALLDAGRARDALAAYREVSATLGDDRHSSLALIGAAAARRILDDLPTALDDLNHAQELADAAPWPDLRARCHFMRGNLFFPMGRVEECLNEHRAALELAERSGNAEARARALGGLGDAEYARGRLLTAGAHFLDCIEESRRIGLGRVEVANLPMYAFTLQYSLEPEAMHRVARQAIDLAITTGQRRAEMISRHAAMSALLDLGRHEEARPHADRLGEIVKELEAWRFEPENLSYRAVIEIESGHAERAPPLLERALEIARKTGMSFVGPAVLAFNARFMTDAAARAKFIEECEDLLVRGAIAHNHVEARAHLIELGWRLGDASFIERHCDKLEAFYRDEPLPLIDFLVRRGRVLAAALRGGPRAMADEARALLAWSEQTGAVRLAAGLEPAARCLES